MAWFGMRSVSWGRALGHVGAWVLEGVLCTCSVRPSADACLLGYHGAHDLLGESPELADGCRRGWVDGFRRVQAVHAVPPLSVGAVCLWWCSNVVLSFAKLEFIPPPDIVDSLGQEALAKIPTFSPQVHPTIARRTQLHLLTLNPPQHITAHSGQDPGRLA